MLTCRIGRRRRKGAWHGCVVTNERGNFRASLLQLTKVSLAKAHIAALIGDSNAGLRFGDIIIHLIALSLYGLGFIQAPPLLHRLKRLD
jgi:hypothetical protein